MQDKLKIRIWHKPTKKMYQVAGLTRSDVIVADLIEDKTFKQSDCEFLLNMRRRDKNNKLFYEGDIVRCYYVDDDTKKLEYDLMIVTYIEEKSSFVLKGTRSSYDFTDFITTDYVQEEYEIVGNIYENPSLLEKQYATK